MRRARSTLPFQLSRALGVGAIAGFKLVEILVSRRMSAIAIIKNVSGWNMIQMLVTAISLMAVAVFLKIGSGTKGSACRL